MGAGPSVPFGKDAAGIVCRRIPRKAAAELGEGAIETGVFAAGCFWGLELAFQRVPGVLRTESGFTGGHKKKLKRITKDYVKEVEVGCDVRDASSMPARPQSR